MIEGALRSMPEGACLYQYSRVGDGIDFLIWAAVARQEGAVVIEDDTEALLLEELGKRLDAGRSVSHPVRHDDDGNGPAAVVGQERGTTEFELSVVGGEFNRLLDECILSQWIR